MPLPNLEHDTLYLLTQSDGWRVWMGRLNARCQELEHMAITRCDATSDDLAAWRTEYKVLHDICTANGYGLKQAKEKQHG